MHRKTRHELFRLTALLIALVLTPATAGANPDQQQPPSATAREQVTGTVRIVHVESSTLEVIDGVGFALRSLPVQVAPACRIQIARREADLKELRFGMIVRMSCRRAAGRLVAESIEVVPVKTGEAP